MKEEFIEKNSSLLDPRQSLIDKGRKGKSYTLTKLIAIIHSLPMVVKGWQAPNESMAIPRRANDENINKLESSPTKNNTKKNFKHQEILCPQRENTTNKKSLQWDTTTTNKVLNRKTQKKHRTIQTIQSKRVGVCSR